MTTKTTKTDVLAEVLAAQEVHLARLPLTPEGLEIVRAALIGDPVRRVHGGPTNVVSRTALGKSDVTNDTESITLEFEHLHILNADPAVVDFRTQAFRLTVHPFEPLADGSFKAYGWQITPDVLVIELGRVVLRDLMLESELIAIEKTRPWYIRRDPDSRRWICPSAEEAAARLGIEYEIASDAEPGRRLLARNCRYLGDFLGANLAESVGRAIIDRVTEDQGSTVADLIEAGVRDGGWTVDDVLSAIAQQVIFCDLNVHAVDNQIHARVYTDAATARAYVAAHPPSWAAVTRRPMVASVTPGTRYTLGGRTLEVFISTGPEVHLRAVDEPGCPMSSMARAQFDQLFAVGALIPDSAATLAEFARAGAAAAWSAAPRPDQETARQRWRALEIWRANRAANRHGMSRLPLPLVDGAVPGKRTLERWDASCKAAELLHGDHLVGLLPKVRRGRPGNRLAVRVADIIDEGITNYYAKPIGRSKKALVDRVRLRCKKALIADLPDRKSILSRLNRRSAYDLARLRGGEKAAYADKPYLASDPDATPVHGLYPFQRVHYDTTITDVEVRDLLSGRNLGRSTLGYLIDAYSDRELARVWGFGEPTAFMLLDALVMVAERFGRLMEELVLDNAKSHWAVAAQVFCAAHGVSITYRPASQGRFGGPVELAFGRITDELFHQIRGNTRAMKLVRTVTDAVEAKRLAVLSLYELDYLMDLWVDKIERVRIVPRLGKTVGVAFEDGLLAHGNRETRRVVVDDLFRMQALIPVGTRIARGNQGIFVKYLTYEHPCFACPEIKGSAVDVSLDYRNVTLAYAFVPAHYHGNDRVDGVWVTAICRILQHLRVVSFGELELASKVIRERFADDARQRKIRALELAEVLEKAGEVEELALARLRVQALEAIRPDHATRSAPSDGSPAASAGEVDFPRASIHAEPDLDPIAALAAQINNSYYPSAQEA